MSTENPFDASTTTPNQKQPWPGDSGTSSWSPPDAIKSRRIPDRSPRRSSANAASGWFSARPRRTDAGAPTSLHLSHSTAYERCLLHRLLLSVRDTHLRAFFDSLDHQLLLRAVAHHTSERWILLYVQRWLQAPLQHEDGTVVTRDRGSPQGSAISPLLANIFAHYALDLWLSREFPGVPFERYADDVILHCDSEPRARVVLAAIAHRMAQVSLELHPGKTRIVYCKDANRKGSHEHERFDFLGFTFGPRSAVGRNGELFVSFCPAISNDAAKAIRRTIKCWRLHLQSGATLADLARSINPIVRGWINYYGRFYGSRLLRSLDRINEYLMRWAMRKYKRLRRRPRWAWELVAAAHKRQPELFAHWQTAATPPRRMMGAG